MKVEKPATCISIYKEALPLRVVSAFLKNIEEEIANDWSENDLSWGNSNVGAGTVTKHRTSLSCSMVTLMKPYPETTLSRDFRSYILEPLTAISRDYIQEYLLPNGIHEPLSLLKYFPGAEYHAHYDHFRDNGRVFSMVASFGEADEGGELEFPFFDTTIKLETGDVVMFPANFPYTHIAHPVLSGVKYSMVTWFS